PAEGGGIVPRPADLKRLQPTEPYWYPGQSVNLSIGQGLLQVTPLQLAVAYSTLANGGAVVRPHVARALLTPRGHVARRARSPPGSPVPGPRPAGLSGRAAGPGRLRLRRPSARHRAPLDTRRDGPVRPARITVRPGREG